MRCSHTLTVSQQMWFFCWSWRYCKTFLQLIVMVLFVWLSLKVERSAVWWRVLQQTRASTWVRTAASRRRMRRGRCQQTVELLQVNKGIINKWSAHLWCTWDWDWVVYFSLAAPPNCVLTKELLTDGLKILISKEDELLYAARVQPLESPDV